MANTLLKGNYMRDSFDRFGDDFCELILSFLSLNEKFKYECVCRQWHRLVFSGQLRLEMNDSDGYYSLKSLGNNELQTKYYNIFTINKTNFESVLKKCSNIKTIEIDWKCICDENSLVLIAKHCPLLERFTIASTEHFPYSELALHIFGKSCAKNLKSFKTDDKFNGNLKLFLNYCSNLTTIQALNDSQKLIDCEKTFLPKLKELDYLLTEDLDLKYFELLTDKYANRMRKLSINIRIGDNSGENQLISTDLNDLFKQISRFVRLKSLKVNLKSYFGQSFARSIQMIGQNCKELEVFDFETYDTIILDNVFDLFRHFSALVYLSLNCRYLYKYETVVSAGHTVDYGSVNSFQNCGHLTHLKLNLLYLNDQNLENIHSVLPNLKVIELKSSKNLSDRSIESMAQLKRLRSVRFFCGKKVTDLSISNLLRLPLLSNIYIDGLPNITPYCLQLLAFNAINNPKLNYKFYYSGTPVPYENILVQKNLKISNFWDKHWY